MDERELIELAAKAAGIVGVWRREHQAYGDQWIEGLDTGARVWWNPWMDDGDALRLAAKLGLKVDANFKLGADKRPGVGVWTPDDTSPYPPFWTENTDDTCKAARQTITRAAAAIGKAMS